MSATATTQAKHAEDVLYICNTQHQKPDGTWHTHQPMVCKSLKGVQDVIKNENTELGGGLINWGKVPRRLQVRKVTLVETGYANLKR